MTEMSLEEAFEFFMAGDEAVRREAQGLVYEAMQNIAKKLAPRWKNYFSDPGDVADVASELFVGWLRRTEGFDEVDSGEALIRDALRKRLISEWRKGQRRGPQVEFDPGRDVNTPEPTSELAKEAGLRGLSPDNWLLQISQALPEAKLVDVLADEANWPAELLDILSEQVLPVIAPKEKTRQKHRKHLKQMWALVNGASQEEAYAHDPETAVNTQQQRERRTRKYIVANLDKVVGHNGYTEDDCRLIAAFVMSYLVQRRR